MSRNNLENILQELGQEAQEKSYDVWNHEFSDSYQQRKEELLNSIPREEHRKKKFKKPVTVAAALILAAGLSVTVYAAVQKMQVTVTDDKENDSVSIKVENTSAEYIPPIEITPNYLPEGYAPWTEGKYSYQGEYAKDGISIFDAGYYSGVFSTDISDYEEIQLGDAKAIVLNRKGYTYPWNIYLFYENTGHVVGMYACEDFSKEEILKVCENLTYVEVPEKDPEHTYQPFSWMEIQSKMEESTESQEKNGDYIERNAIFNVGDTINLGYEMDGITCNVKQFDIVDQIDTSVLTRDNLWDYDYVMPYIQADGSLVPYTRSVSEWIDKELIEKELDTVNVKTVQMTVEIENTTDQDDEDVAACWYWRTLFDNGDTYFQPFSYVPNYEVTEAFRGTSTYSIQYDGMQYYFDASGFPQDKHFYFMTVKAGEKKEVHVWFGIPENELENAYINIERNWIKVQ